MEITDQMVDFEKYCKTCKYKDEVESNIPCCECMENYFNEYTDRPVKYEKKEKKNVK